MKIHTLDLRFQNLERSIATYLIKGPKGYVLVETGPMSTLHTLRTRLRKQGVAVDDVRHVLVTHIHLDHAGAAGWWAQQGATIYVHHVGAPHLVDPSRLWRSAGRIYGEDMERLWGEVLPAPENQVVPLNDGDVIEVAGLTFTAWDTPGHAWHHHLYQLDDVGFSGDAAGIRLVPDEWISLPAPPPEFDLGAWRQTIARIEAMDLDALYLTHYGKVANPARHLRLFKETMEPAVTFIHKQMEEGTERELLIEAYRTWNREKALAANITEEDFTARYEAANPLFMSVDGIMRYWRKRQEED
jgi:glyoxylase-like metal-dependent hydrolase (beta-lactamase superfamily II)